MTTPLPAGPQPNKITLLGIAALAACALAVALAASAVYSAASALFVPSARALVSAQDEKANEAAASFAKSIDDNAAQFNGRSVFFIPSAPPPPPPPPPPPRDDPEPEPAPAPSKPSSYGGPALLAMLSDTIWFANGKKLKIGESDADSGTKLLSVEAPWSAEIEYKGVAFKVPLFARDDVVIKKEEPKPAPADAPADDTTQDAKPENAPSSDNPQDNPQNDKPVTPPAEPSPSAPPPAAPPATEPKEPTPPPPPTPAPSPEPK
jgi:hypothetical protein